MKSKFILSFIVIVTSLFLFLTIFHFRHFNFLMAAFATDLSDRTVSGKENILRAATGFSGTVLKSGEIFSLNEKSGPYTLKRGFFSERTILGKQIVETPGGGVCQVASTLYNAVKIAKLELMERYPHSLPPKSVPEGLDATLAYSVADLKFRNRYPFPIKIVSKVRQNQLIIEIWGKEISKNES